MAEFLAAGIDANASAAELRTLLETRERLASEVERLSAELSQVSEEKTHSRRQGQLLALRQAEELGALRDRAAEAQERAARLEAELGELRRARADEHQAELHAQLGQLRAEIAQVRAEQQKTFHGLWELRRDHTAALAGLTRPGPVEGPPSATPDALRHDYMVVARSGLMDARWYRKHHSDVAALGMDPILHYVEHGWKEGRRPGPVFDGAAYLAANPDLAALGVNPLVHYQTDGAFELRPTAPVAGSAAAASPSVEQARSGPRRLWFFVGDLVEWLNDHEHLTGVGRVTSELLFAAVLADAGRVDLCVLDPAGVGLRQLRDWAPIMDLARRTARNFSPADQAALKAAIARPELRPAAGDHVIFTGVVWTEQYITLFQRLAASDVSFSLLVHDIIPLLVAPTDDGGHAEVFARWLTTALETAETIYVSNRTVAQDVARWAVAARARPRARLVGIGFGSRLLAALEGGEDVLERVERANFVLCVGTIDVRKNQRLLVRIWQELVARLGVDACPQLVLVGRDDISLHAEASFAALERLGKAKLLTGLSDREVSTLYHACRFTAFPSTSEGYGLPVAESLGAGKLCLASDLPAVRAHAGALAWYFDPASLSDAVRTFEHAIASPAEVQAASARIAHDHRVRSWGDTFEEIRPLAESIPEEPFQPPLGREAGAYAGSAHLTERAVLEKAAKWCGDADVEVSILIVNWNAAALTMDCIRQVWAVTEGLRYEIVIADNGSVEAEIKPLRYLGAGVRLIEIGCNRFFGEANNIAAEAAKGRFICFLNNDAFVEVGWLQKLHQTFSDHPRAGAVGPLFRFPDGRIQEGGGFVDAGGYPIRAGRGEREATEDLLKERVVDYISAAALLVDKQVFVQVGGFDLSFEPAYYEDTDLCFKIAAAGREVMCQPEAVVVHIEGASANGDTEAELRRKHLGDLNRGKFVARWGEYLRRRDDDSLVAMRRKLALDQGTRRAASARDGAPRAIVYTPEPLTPGGGERYLLTLTERLLKTHDVALVTPNAYSRLRIHDLAVGFGLDLSRVRTALPSEVAWDGADLQVVMGNLIVPAVSARARRNLFHCQFPFPLPEPPDGPQRERLSGYDRIIVNSRFTALHVEASLNGFQLPDMPINVLPPPARLLSPGVKDENLIRIISVGRFFRGGHSKRQDLLIEAFRALAKRSPRPLELHLAGSSHPAPHNMAYLNELMTAAEGAPIHFHINAAADDLDALYATANIYWHATGLGSNLVAEPWAAEHFGISIVEAMSAGAAAFALASGGAREIITPGVDGFLYDTVDALLEQTLALICGPADRRARLAEAATTRARDFSAEVFGAKLDALLVELGALMA